MKNTIKVILVIGCALLFIGCGEFASVQPDASTNSTNLTIKVCQTGKAFRKD